jgi:hypothetical protein
MVLCVLTLDALHCLVVPSPIACMDVWQEEWDEVGLSQDQGQLATDNLLARRNNPVARNLARNVANETNIRSITTFIATSVQDRSTFGGIYCSTWAQASALKTKWKRYCDKMFSEMRVCYNCGAVAFGGAHAMYKGM